MNNLTVIIRPLQDDKFYTCFINLTNLDFDAYRGGFEHMCAHKAMQQLWTVPENESGFEQFWALGYDLVGIFDGHIHNKIK